MKQLLIFTLMMTTLSATGQTIFYGVSGLFTGDSKQPEVIVISPNGGETFDFSDPLTVNWTAVDDSLGPAPVSIGISLGSGAYIIVASNLPNTGQAVVTPPGIATDLAKVLVIATDTFGNEGVDESDEPFTFYESFSAYSPLFTGDSKPPQVTVLLPNGNEIYYYAEPLLVNWDASDDSLGTGPVTISVSTDAGTTYNTVASGLPNSGSAYVTAPAVLTDNALLKVDVQDEFGLTAFDESDEIFELRGILVNLKVFLEGPFATTGMGSHLNSFGYLPLSQPYNQPPWNYTGTENVEVIPNDDVVDWVLIGIRDAADASSATAATTIAQQAGFIMQNGSIVALDGSSTITFGKPVNQNLFAVVKHRNHLGIMSAIPLNVVGSVYSYDFTDGISKVYGGDLGFTEVAPGIYGMMGGDGNADGQVNNPDKNDVWLPQFGTSGYLSGDFDMDGNVNNQDKIQVWDINAGTGSQIPD